MGYYLKDRAESETNVKVAVAAPDQSAVRDKLAMLRRRQAELDREEKDLMEKLSRVKGKDLAKV